MCAVGRFVLEIGGSVECCRREDRGVEGAEGVECGRGLLIPTWERVWGEGCAPSPEKFSIF